MIGVRVAPERVNERDDERDTVEAILGIGQVQVEVVEQIVDVMADRRLSSIQRLVCLHRVHEDLVDRAPVRLLRKKHVFNPFIDRADLALF